MMIKIIVVDIDGTLTDGGIYYGNSELEIKKFNVRDAAGVLGAEAVGIDVMFLTGRESDAVARRAYDLKVKYCVQGISNKCDYLDRFLRENRIDSQDVLYIGDDLNDLAVMKKVGHAACPADAADEVIDVCEYVSSQKGGYGAVRDIIFHYLKEMHIYEEAISRAYGGI